MEQVGLQPKRKIPTFWRHLTVPGLSMCISRLKFSEESQIMEREGRRKVEVHNRSGEGRGGYAKSEAGFASAAAASVACALFRRSARHPWPTPLFYSPPPCLISQCSSPLVHHSCRYLPLVASPKTKILPGFSFVCCHSPLVLLFCPDLLPYYLYFPSFPLSTANSAQESVAEPREPRSNLCWSLLP